jgi:hypothetical protein
MGRSSKWHLRSENKSAAEFLGRSVEEHLKPITDCLDTEGRKRIRSPKRKQNIVRKRTS